MLNANAARTDLRYDLEISLEEAAHGLVRLLVTAVVEVALLGFLGLILVLNSFVVGWIAPGMARRPSPVRAMALNRPPSSVRDSQTPPRSMKMN